MKAERFIETQTAYTNLINHFIEMLSKDEAYFLDIFTNNKQSPRIRGLEKRERTTHSLGAAYGQNAIDEAVTKIHNHFIRIRNNLYGYIQIENPELLPYVSFFSLLNASILDTDELQIIDQLIYHALAAEKPNKQLIETYENLRDKLCRLTEEQRVSNKEYVCILFHEKSDYKKLPFVKKAPLQLDTRMSKLERSHSTKEDFVVSMKLLNESRRQGFPVSTSKNGLRRLAQYKNGTMTATIVSGKLKVGVPVTKKIRKQKQKALLGVDLGITDLFHTSTKNKYGTFTGMVKRYESAVEEKLGNRSSLRNKRREYQRQLKRTSNPREKDRLRRKIKNVSDSLNGKKSLQKRRRSYAHVVDMEIGKASKQLFHEIRGKKYLPVFEDLDIVTFDRGKKANKRDSIWVRGKLMKKVTELLEWHGFNYETVDPAYTSKMCGKCCNVHDDNRKGKRFTCTVCKHTADADHNASINIRERALDTEIANIVVLYEHNTKKRHQALRELLYTRHCSYMKNVS